MKKRSKLTDVLIKVFAVIIVLLISMNVFKHNVYVQSVDRNFFSFFSMVRYGLIDYPVQTISGVFKDTATLWDVRSENDALKKKLDYDYHWQSLIDELQTEVDELKALNDLKSVYSDRSLRTATVKNTAIEAWNQTFEIDRGSADGIKVGDGVINAQGIVGKVISVNENQATVSTIFANNEHSQVAVKIKVADGLYVNGILQSYDSNTELFSIRLLETHTSVTEGMSVSTSGMGGIFPAGFYAGTIDSVKETADSLGTIVYMESQVSYSNLKYVTVVGQE